MARLLDIEELVKRSGSTRSRVLDMQRGGEGEPGSDGASAVN